MGSCKTKMPVATAITGVIKVKGAKVVEYIDREVKVFDSNCAVPEVAIKAHDMSASNEAPPENTVTVIKQEGETNE